MKSVQTDSAPSAIGPYSQATIANGFLYTAGQIPLDPATGQIVRGETIAQTQRVMQNLQAILESEGLGWEDVVKTTVYLTDLSLFPTMNEVYATFVGSARPARSTVQVAALPRGALVEIDLVAALKR